jgi:acyl-CoA reductase-like NAD-dependent aldehyde dehydrogenase
MPSAEASVPIIVDGKAFPTQGTFPVYDPQDRTTVLYSVSSLPAASVADVTASSKKAFPAWRDMPYAEKRKIFFKAAQLFQERIPELVQTITTETTAPTGFASFDIGVLAAACLEETTAVMSTALRGEMAPLDASGKRMMVIKERYGVVLSIPAWNAPGKTTF